MPADKPKWGDLAPDRLFHPNAMVVGDAPKMIGDRGMVEVNRGLVRAMRDDGFTHATPQYAGTGTTYLHGVHPALAHPVTMRFSTHAHDIKQGGTDRPFGELRGDKPHQRLHYDIDTTARPEKFRARLNEAREHLQRKMSKQGS